MTRILHLWPEPVTDTGTTRTWSVTCELPSKRWTLWFRMPLGEAPTPTSTDDAFLIATLFPAMEHAEQLHLHGVASPSLLDGLDEVQTAWHRWSPERYRPVDIRCDRLIEPTPSGRGRAVQAFSGGLDSTFTAWQLVRGRPRAEGTVLGAGLMVHGFDIPLSDEVSFARATHSARNMLSSLGIPLITMATNFRADGGSWEDRHGTALAAALHLLRDSFDLAVVASSHTYEHLRFPWGSNPVTDPLLGSKGFPLLHHGCGHSRADKAAAVAGWDEGMRLLRVCWQGTLKDRNCGRCQRCVGTAICFAAQGLSIPSAIPIADLGAAIRTLPSEEVTPMAGKRLSELVSLAERNRIAGPWITDLRDLLVRIGAPLPLPSRVRRRFQRWLYLGSRHMAKFRR